VPAPPYTPAPPYHPPTLLHGYTPRPAAYGYPPHPSPYGAHPPAKHPHSAAPGHGSPPACSIHAKDLHYATTYCLKDDVSDEHI